MAYDFDIAKIQNQVNKSGLATILIFNPALNMIGKLSVSLIL